jgi:hypothetical protein
VSCLHVKPFGLALLATVAVMSAMVGLGATSASADPGSPFVTLSGSVDPNGFQEIDGTPLAAAASSVVARMTESGASEVEIAPPGSGSFSVGSGDVVWAPVGGEGMLAAGTTPEIEASNDDPVNSAVVSAELFTVPAGPVSYSGVESSLSGPSELPFTTLGDAPYVANVSVSGGAVQVSGGQDSHIFDSPGQYSLGEIAAGGGTLTIRPVAGPPAQWSVTITPLPIALTGVSLNHAAAQPGVINTLTFTNDGSTSITANITDSAGTVVRTLASNLPESPGTNTLVWDGRDSSGIPVPTGTYTVTVTSTDPLGNVSTGQASIEIDSTPPTASLVASTLTPTQAVQVNFADQGSGLASAAIQMGSIKRALLSGQTTVSYAPKRWSPGRYTLTATAKDRAGNTTTRTLQFVVKASTAASSDPKCVPGDLKIHFVSGEGATAMFISTFQFINVSHHECHLVGYPGAAAYDRAGRELHLKVLRESFTSRRPQLVRLTPDGHASFETNTSAFRSKGCVTAHRMRFTPPGDTSSLSIRHRLLICSAQMGIGAVQRSG